MDLYSALCVVPHTKALRHGSQFYLQITPCLSLSRKCSPDGATTDLWWGPPNCSLLLIYQPWKDEMLSWPSWLTYSRQFTHISGQPSAVGWAQRKESLPVKDRHSTTAPCNQPHPKWAACNLAAITTLHHTTAVIFLKPTFKVKTVHTASEILQ